MAELTNQYKRRSDLVPSLVEVVKAFAKYETETFKSVVEARAKATQATIDISKVTPEQLQAFEKVQSELSQALGRLLMISENYPDLKSNENFRTLQIQLEGTENRIAIARRNYIESIKRFNNLVDVFPTKLTNQLFFKFEKAAQWTADAAENVETVPKLDF